MFYLALVIYRYEGIYKSAPNLSTDYSLSFILIDYGYYVAFAAYSTRAYDIGTVKLNSSIFKKG